jgi:hypothetical protein
MLVSEMPTREEKSTMWHDMTSQPAQQARSTILWLRSVAIAKLLCGEIKWIYSGSCKLQRSAVEFVGYARACSQLR